MGHGDPLPTSPKFQTAEFGGGVCEDGLKMGWRSLGVFYSEKKSPLIAELRDFAQTSRGSW